MNRISTGIKKGVEQYVGFGTEMDEYEILTMGDYERDYDIERECDGWKASIHRP